MTAERAAAYDPALQRLRPPARRARHAAALILLAMVVIVTADIVLRNLDAQRHFVWANEVSEYSLYLITLLTAPWLLRRGQHVRLDIILTLVPRAWPG